MAHKPSVVIVSHYAMPHTGGIEQVVDKQAKALSERGFTVSVLTTASKDEEKGEIVTREGLVVKRLSAFTFMERHFFIPFPIIGVRSLISMWKTISLHDTVHVHDMFYQPCWFAVLFARMQKKTVFLTQHVALVEHNALVVFIQKAVYRLFGTLMLRVSKGIIVYNDIVRAYLIESMRVPEEKVHHIRNGVDTSVFSPASAEEKTLYRKKYNLPLDKKIVLYVGRFVSKKGYKELYEARDEAYDIVFVGSGSVPSEWKNTKGVHILGEHKSDEVVEIFKSADIFVSPTKGELFTLVMQEAFACGLPVITTKEKEYEQYNLDEKGIVLCDPQSETLKRELLSLAYNPDRLKYMSSYSRKLAESLFDWNKNIEQMFDVYKDVNKKKVIVTTSWDDGHKLDVRVAGLLKQYGIKGTFYVASKNREFKDGEALTELELCTLSRDFEIGAHTVTHRLLTQISESDVEEEITESKKLLENMLKKDVVSFCYPRGKYSKKIAKCVESAGFLYARTVKRFHTNYMIQNKFLAPTSIDTYDHYSDVWSVLKFVHFNPITFFTYFRKWDAIAIEMFDRTHKHGGVFHLWGHSWQLEEHGDWNRLDKVLKHIGGHTDVLYVENKDIYLSR